MQTQQKRVLCDRISRQQKTKLLEIMREHPDIARGTIRGVENLDALWVKFTRTLNSIMGAKKKTNQWKRSWTDWKASIRKQVMALVAYDKGNWTKDEPPKIIEPLDLQIVEYITNLPPDCLGYDVLALNDATAELLRNKSRSMSPIDPSQVPKSREPHIGFNMDSTIKQEDGLDEEFDDCHSELKYENGIDTEYEITLLEEPSVSNSTFLNESHGMPPPLHRPAGGGGSFVNNRPSSSSSTDYLLEQLLREQRKTNELLQKTLNMLMQKHKP